MHDCTLLVCSCDKYEDAWYPYFSLLKKYWADYSEYVKNIVLLTDTKKLTITGDLNIILEDT